MKSNLKAKCELQMVALPSQAYETYANLGPRCVQSTRLVRSEERNMARSVAWRALATRVRNLPVRWRPLLYDLGSGFELSGWLVLAVDSNTGFYNICL